MRSKVPTPFQKRAVTKQKSKLHLSPNLKHSLRPKNQQNHWRSLASSPAPEEMRRVDVRGVAAVAGGVEDVVANRPSPRPLLLRR